MTTKPEASGQAAVLSAAHTGAPAPSSTRADLRPEVVVESVFLSPRVVDRKAFGELSGELRSLIERAATERVTISDTLQHALAAAKTAKDVEANQAGNLALAAKALKGLDERIARASKVVDDAAAAAESLRDLEARADRLIEAKIAALEARLDAAQAAGQARAEAVQDRLTGAAREIEQRVEAIRRDADALLGAKAEGLHATLVKAEQALTGMSNLRDLVTRGEGVQAAADASMRRLEEAQNVARNSRETMTGLLNELALTMGRVDAQRETLGTESDRVREACKQAGHAIDQRLLAAQGVALGVAEDARKAASDALAEIKPRIEAAATKVAAAATDTSVILGEARAAHENLKVVIAQAHDAHNTTGITLRLAEKNASEIATMLAALEPWRKFLDQDDGAEVPPPVRALLDTVRRELKADLAGIAGALRGVAASAERTIDAIDAAGPTPVVTATTPASAGALLGGPGRERAIKSHAAD